MEIVKDLLERNGKLTGYITGTAAFARMGLTAQITSAITIGTKQYRRPLKRGEYTVSFILQPDEITEDNIPLLCMLDAIKLLRKIPATVSDDCIRILTTQIGALSEDELKRLAELAAGYTPYVCTLLGAILESIGTDTYALCKTLNGTTKYNSIQALPTKRNWNIPMRLHENKSLFADAIEAAARPQNEGGLGIKSLYRERLLDMAFSASYDTGRQR